MPSNLDHYLRAFRTLHVNRAGERTSPHKPCMLLAVLGMAEAGDLGEIRRWVQVPEMENRYLRVVLLPDGETVHNAFFDRRYAP